MVGTVENTRRKRRSPEELHDRILEAAGAEFELSGYGGATTAAIARRADVTEAQIFRLFASKADLFRAAIFNPLNRHFADFHAANVENADPQESDRELSRRYINELQDFMEQHSRMLMSLIVANAYEQGASEGVGAIAGLSDYFERGAALMSSRVGEGAAVDPQLMVRVSFAAVLANVMFKDWLFPDGIANAEAIRAAIADFVIDGIRVNHNAAANQDE